MTATARPVRGNGPAEPHPKPPDPKPPIISPWGDPTTPP